MKLFLKLFFTLLLVEIFIGFSALFVYQKTDLDTLGSILNFLIIIASFPMYLYDKTYPFYANVSTSLLLLLVFLNILIQAFFIQYLGIVVKRIGSNRK